VLTPYRSSARERRAPEDARRATPAILRLVGTLFVLAAAASAVALYIFGGGDPRRAIAIGVWVDRTVGLIVPIVLLALGICAAPRTPLRVAAVGTSAAWLAAFGARFPPLVDSYAITASISLVRVVAVAGLSLLPFLAAHRRVVPRWTLFSIIGLAAGDGARKIDLARYGVVPAHFDPSPTTMAICALLAYTFLVAARELGGESIDERAERFAPIATALFPTEVERNAFLGPVRLATDAVLAFAIATLVATTTTVAYSRSLRLDAPPAGPEASALLVIVTAALIWLKRSANAISLAPIIGAIAATAAAIFSTMYANGAAMSVALIPLGVAVLALGVVAPRTRDADARTMRRWVTFVSASGVMLGSAGFFAIYSFGQGEPALARIAKLGAVVFGLLAASASARLEGHARIELAAEHRAP
jgi:hypothetical protein